jgi:hypothetical protein
VLRSRASGRGGPLRSAACLAAVVAALGLSACSRADAPPSPPALPDAEVSALLAALVGDDAAAADSAAERAARAGDPRLIAPLVELVVMKPLGAAPGLGFETLVRSLEALSGEHHGASWGRWAEWYARRDDLSAPPGFAAWKARLLAGLDPGFARFFAEGAPARVRVEEIVWGGVPLDGIPALDDPQTLAASEAAVLEDGEPVFGVRLGGEARAYPLRILDWHELVNDVVGGTPIALAYCTLCGSAIAYDATAPDGERERFASSGLLYRSNKLMYDRRTHSLWSQLTGRPVLGELAASDRALRAHPGVLTSWGAWREQHPETRVLGPATGHARPYRLGAAYGHYFASPGTMFPVGPRSEALRPKVQVYGVAAAGAAKAWPLEALTEARVVNDAVGGLPLVLVATRGMLSVRGESLQVGPVRYAAGAEVRAFARGEREFRPGDDSASVVDEAGRIWRITEDALVGPGGERAPRSDGGIAYWFAWYATHRDTALYASGK